MSIDFFATYFEDIIQSFASHDIAFISLLTLVLLLSGYQFYSIYVFKRLMRTIKRANIFVAFFHIPKQKFSYFTKRKSSLKFNGLKFKSFESFISQFSPNEQDGIRLAFTSLSDHSKPISINLTSANGDRNFRLTARRFRGNSKRAIIVLQDTSKIEDEKTSLRLECKMLTSTVNTYKTLFDHLPTPLWVRQDHEILYFNPACAKIFKAPSFESLQNSPDRISIHDLGSLLSLTDTPTPVILGGNRHLFTFQERPVDHGLTLGFGVDKTEISKKEREIDEHLSSYKEVLETLSAGVAIYDHNQELTYFNHAYSRMFGFDEQWLLTNPPLGAVLDNLRERRLLPEQAEYQAFKTEQLKRLGSLLEPFEGLNHLPDGRIVREILAPHPQGGGFYIFEDLSDRMRLEQKYNTQLAVQSAALDNLFEGVAVFGSDNRLQFTNSAFAKIWSTNPDQLKTGTHLSDVAEMARQHIDIEDEWDQYRDRVMSLITDRVPKQRVINRKDGMKIEFSYIPLPDGSHMMSYHDITDRIRLQSAYEEKKIAQQQSDRLKSDFISNMSYEMRSPLSTIIGYSDLLMSVNDNLSTDQKSYCRNIQVSSKRLLNLVNNILDLAMIESGHMQLKFSPCDFWQLFRETIDHYNQQIDPALPPISFDLPETTAYIKADKTYLKKTLETLLLNVSSEDNFGHPIMIEVEQNNDHLSLNLSIEKDTNETSLEANDLSAAVKPGRALGQSLINHILKEHNAEFEEVRDESYVTTKVVFTLEQDNQNDKPPKETQNVA